PASRGDGAGWEETEPDGKPSMPNRAELAAFLRRRPHRLHPADVGLPGTGPRRTPGLRRQEVAQLAGISVDYYIRLEQGRGSHPSRQVLGALARAFMLTADERDYLFRTAGELPPHLERPTSTPPEAVRHLLDAMDGVPAYVVDAKGDVVAWNRLARHFVGDLDQAPPERRNLLRWIFGHAAADPAWDDEHTVAFAAAMVADLRAAYGRYSGDPGIEALVDELLAASDRFADMWSARGAAAPPDREARRPPGAGAAGVRVPAARRPRHRPAPHRLLRGAGLPDPGGLPPAAGRGAARDGHRPGLHRRARRHGPGRHKALTLTLSPPR